MFDTETLLTARQLQHLLQVDRITIYRMLNDGRFQGFKVGGQWRFSRQAIERWLRDQQAGLDANGASSGAGDVRPSPDSLPPRSGLLPPTPATRSHDQPPQHLTPGLQYAILRLAY